ncbi:hypothetical protein AMS69_08970 [Haloarcula rubripromontorii]|uniref:Uncharacterized protein n=1 Tax=Haloarcula rubripromontorii TaxID=1705562 RepID=A0A0M9AKQ5_9EURY|nr:DUF6498-containing protein [Haloarcula rubripromontorii]KOX94037.1 hypothetical protein AMS69_08970 [Haloarcula rubripromontorii]
MSSAALQRRADQQWLTLTLVLVSNSLPVAGVVVLGWRAAELLVLYWIEVVVMVAAYSVAALFAKQPVVLKDREFYIVGYGRREEVDEDTWSGEPEPINWFKSVLPEAVESRLPPMYRRNLPVVGRSLAVVLFLAILWGYLTNTLSNPVTALRSPTVILGSLIVCTSQLAELRREYFAPRTYEDWSAYMTVEAAQRVVAFYIMLAIVVVPVTIIGLLVFGFILDLVFGGLVIPAAAGGAAGVDLSVFAPVVVFSAGKAVVDWSRRAVGIRTDADGLAGWFTPENPHVREWEQERH